MRAVRAVTLCLACSVPTLIGAASTQEAIVEKNSRKDCSANSQAAMKDCLAKKALESDRELKQAEASVISSLSKWDEDAKYPISHSNH